MHNHFKVKLRDTGNTESKMRERLEELDTLNEPMRTETAQVDDALQFSPEIDFPDVIC